jgi:hypothetical protein
MRYLSILAVLFGVLGLSLGVAVAADPQTHEGTVVSAAAGKRAEHLLEPNRLRTNPRD